MSSDQSPDSQETGTAAPGQAEGAGAAPRTVIRGESFQGVEVLPYAALTDYLNCTFRLSEDRGELAHFFARLFACLGKAFAPAEDRGRGKHGYKRSFALGEAAALFCIGGQRGTAFLSLSGSACELVPSWPAAVAFLRDELSARITRWDGAVDDFFGHHSVDGAVDLYLGGAYTTGGNRPSCSQRGNWLEADGTGRTFYVGKRENGKLLRVYEKGLQLWPRSGNPWVRWEVELHNVDRIIPWEVLLSPGKYFVGAYPKALHWAHEEMSRIRTRQQQVAASYGHLMTCASVAYGALVNVMLHREGSAERVVELLRQKGAPPRLRLPPLPDDKPSEA